MVPLMRATIIGLSLLFVLGCTDRSSQPKSPNPAPKAGNQPVAYCPVMEHEIEADSDTKVTTQWNGKTVTFCCKACLPKWEKLTENEKEEALSRIAKLAKDNAPSP